MENLIQKWKSSNAAVRSGSKNSAPNSTKKPKYDFSSSSEETTPEKDRYSISMKTQFEIAAFNVLRDLTLSASKLTQGEKKATPLRGHDSNIMKYCIRKGRQHADQPLKSSDFSGSGKKPTGRGKKAISQMIEECTYKIMDIFKYSPDISNQEKIKRIKEQIEEVAEHCSLNSDELEQKVAQLKQETTRVAMIARSDTSAKIITELETRLFDSEKEKAHLRRERDSLVEKVTSLENEKKSTHISQELLDMVKKNQIILEETNRELLGSLAETRRKEQEQQAIWENEVNDLTAIIHNLKEQLNKAHEREFA